MEMMLDKKQIWAFFFFNSEKIIKQQRQLSVSTMHLPQELLMKI